MVVPFSPGATTVKSFKGFSKLIRNENERDGSGKETNCPILPTSVLTMHVVNQRCTESVCGHLPGGSDRNPRCAVSTAACFRASLLEKELFTVCVTEVLEACK